MPFIVAATKNGWPGSGNGTAFSQHWELRWLAIGDTWRRCYPGLNSNESPPRAASVSYPVGPVIVALTACGCLADAREMRLSGVATFVAAWHYICITRNSPRDRSLSRQAMYARIRKLPPAYIFNLAIINGLLTITGAGIIKESSNLI